MSAPDPETLADRIRALSLDERSWVLFWLAYDTDPEQRTLLGAALDHQAERAHTWRTLPWSGSARASARASAKAKT